MRSINKQKAIRRANVTLLLDQVGQKELAAKTGIEPAFLYQMGKGNGKQARNVSDAKVNQIESKLGLPTGWMDEDHTGEESKEEIKKTLKLMAHGGRNTWPFPNIEYERFENLNVGQKLQIEGMLLEKIEEFEGRHPAQLKSGDSASR